VLSACSFTTRSYQPTVRQIEIVCCPLARDGQTDSVKKNRIRLSVVNLSDRWPLILAGNDDGRRRPPGDDDDDHWQNLQPATTECRNVIMQDQRRRRMQPEGFQCGERTERDDGLTFVSEFSASASGSLPLFYSYLPNIISRISNLTITTSSCCVSFLPGRR
jgi:hypothetical protein